MAKNNTRHVVRRAKYNQRDIILYALSIDCKDEKYVFEGSGDFQPFPTFVAILAFKGESDDIQCFPPPSMIDPLPKHFIINNANVKTPPKENIVVIHVSQDFLYLGKDGFPVPNHPGENIEIDLEQSVVKVVPKSNGIFVTVITNYIVVSKKQSREKHICCQGISTYLVVGIHKDSVVAFEDLSYTGIYWTRTYTKVFHQEPDSTIQIILNFNQSLLYRIASGDYNLIHVKDFNGGKPIMHGLCVIGIVVKTISEYLSGEFGLNREDSSLVFHMNKLSVKFSAMIPAGSKVQLKVWKVICQNSIVIGFQGYIQKKLVLRDGFLEIKFKSSGTTITLTSLSKM